MSDYQNDLSSTHLPTPLRDPVKMSQPPPETLNKEQGDVPLDPSNDARALVRLLQCSKCSYPITNPMTLPCGNSLCKGCMPELHSRANISYPATAGRLHGFSCPFAECRQEHAIGDCSQDVTFTKVMELLKANVEVLRPSVQGSPLLLEEVDKWAISGVASLNGNHARSRMLQGSRLLATYTMVELGELAYDSEVKYTQSAEAGDEYHALDVVVLEHLKEMTRTELDCQVCYALFLDPLTTACGHTFCRKCLRRSLDHSDCCPICRRGLAVSPSLPESQYPSNNRLNALLNGLCPDAVAARAEAVHLDEMHHISELDTPLFICTLSFPHMPTFLHVFEPRYRLMIRRAIESGDRKFGMLLHNPRQSPQGDLGNVRFYQYGTLLHIVNMQVLPDGRSLIETVGVSRFRVLKHGVLDAYQVGQIERVNDISLADEEALEASETAITESAPHALSAADHFGSPPHHQSTNTNSARRNSQFNMADLNKLSTVALMDAALAFVRRMEAQSAPWLQNRLTQSYGPCPLDPALFPWWFASILPIAEIEKYRLLGTTSVRERLKICVGWVVRIEAQR